MAVATGCRAVSKPQDVPVGMVQWAGSVASAYDETREHSGLVTGRPPAGAAVGRRPDGGCVTVPGKTPGASTDGSTMTAGSEGRSLGWLPEPSFEGSITPPVLVAWPGAVVSGATDGGRTTTTGTDGLSVGTLTEAGGCDD